MKPIVLSIVHIEPSDGVLLDRLRLNLVRQLYLRITGQKDYLISFTKEEYILYLGETVKEQEEICLRMSLDGLSSKFRDCVRIAQNANNSMNRTGCFCEPYLIFSVKTDALVWDDLPVFNEEMTTSLLNEWSF